MEINEHKLAINAAAAIMDEYEKDKQAKEKIIRIQRRIIIVQDLMLIVLAAVIVCQWF